MFITILIMVFAVFTISVFIPKKAYAWKGRPNTLGQIPGSDNVHYNDTFAWCMENGMNSSYASIAAMGCTEVDAVYALDLSWHFDRRYFTGAHEDTRITHASQEFEAACMKIDEASLYIGRMYESPENTTAFSSVIENLKRESLILFGRSLHPIQDKYAHMTAGYYTSSSLYSHMEPGFVEVMNLNGSIRERKRLGDLFDDVNYDYVGDIEEYPLSGTWYYVGNLGKAYNSRWQNTRDASLERISAFLDYAYIRNISFS